MQIVKPLFGRAQAHRRQLPRWPLIARELVGLCSLFGWLGAWFYAVALAVPPSG